MAAATVIDRTALADAARQARERAYAPYSKYHVGAALLTDDGRTFTGCNVENASYPATICAERVAITKAVSEGQRKFLAIAVATSNAAAPCGICRQVMNEFSREMIVLLVDDEQIVEEHILADLLPNSFGPGDLPGMDIH
jgi:cytidine deaminase